jgi:hypothetical protein
MPQNFPLFQKLKSDPEIFTTIRHDYISFYYKGCSLFTFKSNAFHTHQKYKILWDSQHYSSQNHTASLNLSQDYWQDYEKIKSNSRTYANAERDGVGQVCRKGNFLHGGDIVVLDVEINFNNLEEESKQDRIDLVLYNTKTRALRFVEAKQFCNGELWAAEGKKAEVFHQVDRYQRQLIQNREQILDKYAKSVERINELFGLSLQAPVQVMDEVVVFVFGYDVDQRDGRLKNRFINNEANKEYRYYACGNPSACNLGQLFKGIKL